MCILSHHHLHHAASTSSSSDNFSEETQVEVTAEVPVEEMKPKPWPAVYMFPAQKVTFDAQEFLANPHKLKEKTQNTKDREQLSFCKSLVDIIYEDVTTNLTA